LAQVFKEFKFIAQESNYVIPKKKGFISERKMNAAEITAPLRLEDLQTKIAHNKRITFVSTDGLDSYKAYFNIIDGSDKVAVLRQTTQFVDTMRMCGCTEAAMWERVMLCTMRGTAADY